MTTILHGWKAKIWQHWPGWGDFGCFGKDRARNLSIRNRNGNKLKQQKTTSHEPRSPWNMELFFLPLSPRFSRHLHSHQAARLPSKNIFNEHFFSTLFESLWINFFGFAVSCTVGKSLGDTSKKEESQWIVRNPNLMKKIIKNPQKTFLCNLACTVKRLGSRNIPANLKRDKIMLAKAKAWNRSEFFNCSSV